MSMSISYEHTGRKNQKARTRRALVSAARDMVRQGVTPTVEEAAEAASVSRATAYRYFPNQRVLLVAAHPEVDAPSLLGEDAPTDPEARLDRVVTELAKIFLDSEESYRNMLRLSLASEPRGPDLALRKGRRFIWIEDALAPLRREITSSSFARLVHAVSISIGIEALITLVDLAGLSRDQAIEVMRWTARSLLRAAVAEARTVEGGTT